MFTGIIQAQTKIKCIETDCVPWRISIDNPWSNLSLGDSIALDGICLTLVAFTDALLTFEVSSETLKKTTVPQWSVGRAVNLERSLKSGDALGGHFVTGHIDGVAYVKTLKQSGECLEMTFTGFQGHEGQLVEKGSVTINGVSLTVNEVTTEDFNVTLIPETLTRTNLQGVSVGTAVNIEYDILSKLIEKQLQLHLKGKAHETIND